MIKTPPGSNGLFFRLKFINLSSISQKTQNLRDAEMRMYQM